MVLYIICENEKWLYKLHLTVLNSNPITSKFANGEKINENN